MKKMKLIALCQVFLLLLTACGAKKPAETTTPETTAAVETTVPAATVPETTAATETETLPPPAEDHIIATPYGDLHFPGDWISYLKTETTEDPYTVTFFALLDTRNQPQKLFTLSFGGAAEEASAAVETDDGYVALKIVPEEFAPDDTWEEADIHIVYAMQENLNHVLVNLPLTDADVLAPAKQEPSTPETQQSQQSPAQTVPGSQEQSEELPEEMKADMAVDTPYMELHYPSKWADTLSIKTETGGVYSVSYFCKIGDYAPVRLFTVYFGGQTGALLKTIKTEAGEMVEIRIDVPELSLLNEWTEEQKSTAYGMQEDLNYLLEKMN